MATLQLVDLAVPLTQGSGATTTIGLRCIPAVTTSRKRIIAHYFGIAASASWSIATLATRTPLCTTSLTNNLGIAASASWPNRCWRRQRFRVVSDLPKSPSKARCDYGCRNPGNCHSHPQRLI
jgi:hypothetical protein